MVGRCMWRREAPLLRQQQVSRLSASSLQVFNTMKESRLYVSMPDAAGIYDRGRLCHAAPASVQVLK